MIRKKGTRMRKTWVDIAKGMGILLVCIGHTRMVENKIICSLIYAFHMPFFFMIAGYCYDENRYKSYGSYFVRKLKALAWPYIMLTFAVALITTVLFLHPERNEFVTLLGYPYPGCWMIGFWFVQVLFFVELIYAVLRRWSGWGLCIICLGFGLISSYMGWNL